LILQAFFAKSTCATERFLIIISTDDAASFIERNATEENSWLYTAADLHGDIRERITIARGACAET
jgi:hypothetical protein